MSVTASQVNGLIARLRSPHVPQYRPSSLERLTDDAADALADLLKQIEALKSDADRWRKLAGDVCDDEAPVIYHTTQKIPQPARTLPWDGYGSSEEVQVVSVDVPVREVKIRWLDIDGKRRTLREMIDGQLKELNEAKSS
jgi:hypothetical protein